MESKSDVTDGKVITSAIDEPSKSSTSDSEDNLVDVEDSDDYLLHLEAILKTIHARFYSYYKEHGKVNIIVTAKRLIDGIQSSNLSLYLFGTDSRSQDFDTKNSK